MVERAKVVIVGAGFGGLEATRALAGVPVDITLVDRHNYHCFQPLLYQVATAALSPADIAWPIRNVVRRQRNVTVLMAAVDGVDPTERRVRAGAVALPYDFLVLATGATHSYFGHDEWASVAPGLKDIEDATSIRQRLLLAFERAELCEDEALRRRLMGFVIVGGGPTGVELAGAVSEVARQALPSDFRRIDPRAARIVLVEAGPRILPQLPENLSDYAARTLARMGVEVMTSTRVTGCDDAGVDLEGGRIDAGSLIWAAGVIASPAARWLGAEHDRSGRVKVGPDLAVPGHPEIFAVGDTVTAADASGRPIAGIAPAAKQMGRHVGRTIAARVAGRPSAPFRYRHYGDLATIGRKAAVVKLDRRELTGLVGWLFWSVAHIFFLIGVRNRVIVAISWVWSYVTFQRSARLITFDRSAPGTPRGPRSARPDGAGAEPARARAGAA